MAITLDPALIEEFSSLLSNEGIHDVSHWILPNDDVPFDEELALEEFGAQLEGAFAATSAAIDSIRPNGTVPTRVAVDVQSGDTPAAACPDTTRTE